MSSPGTAAPAPAETARPRTGGRGRTPALDAACAEAVDLARAAAVAEVGAGSVGEHQGVAADGDRVATHYFGCRDAGYVGWRWAVTVARASRARAVTVDEVVLLPGEGALLAPDWLPWSERLRPGDLGVGDLLPTEDDDDRLAPAWAYLDAAGEPVDADETADPAAAGSLVRELGLGRARVLSAVGRDDAVDRWWSGDRGPDAPIAQAAPAPCGSCGFWLPLAGALRPLFGACANEYAPDDGRVVSADHGCGAHSEAVVVPTAPEVASAVVDDYRYDVERTDPAAAEPAGADPGADPGTTSVGEGPAAATGSVAEDDGEELGHS